MKTYDKIKAVLVNDCRSRDSDWRLVYFIHREELYLRGREINGINYQETLVMISEGKLTSPETITRIRRKIQESDEKLRGKKYEERHKLEQKVRNEIKLF